MAPASYSVFTTDCKIKCCTLSQGCICFCLQSKEKLVYYTTGFACKRLVSSTLSPAKILDHYFYLFTSTYSSIWLQRLF